MKKGLVRLLVLAAVAAFSAQARGQGPARGGEAPLTNASVVKLVRAGFSEKAVIAIIRARPVNFDLAPERLIELKKSGVGEKVILAMIGRGMDELAGDDWGDDMPLGDDGAAGRGGDGAGRQGSGSDQGSTGIFGSSGGSKGRVRSRGGSGGADNDTQTTG